MDRVSIFQPNNHSQWRIAYKSITPEVSDRVKKILLEQYDLDRVAKVEQVAEVEVNSNNFKVTVSDGKCFLLRRYITNSDGKMAERTLDIIERLAGQGVRVPQVVKTVGGGKVAVVAGEPHALFAFVEADHYRGTGEELVSAGREIAHLDKALADLPPTHDWEAELSLPEKTKELRSYDLEIWQEIFRKAEERATSESVDQFHAELLNQKDFILQSVKETLVAKPSKTSFGVVHFDLHPHNLLADGKEILTILDLDSLRYLERARALAFAFHRMVRQYVIFNQRTDYAPATAEAKNIFINEYLNFHNLDKTEISSISYFIRDEALCRLTYAMKDQYFNNNPAWRQDLPKQTASLAEAAYFE